MILVLTLMFPQSNCTPTELLLSVVLVQQFGIASQRNISETHHYLLMCLGRDGLRHSCLLVINIPAML